MAGIPDFMRRVMEKAGVDVDKVEADLPAAAAAIEAPDVHEQRMLPPVLPTGDPGPVEPEPEQLGLSDPDANRIGAFHAGSAGAPDTERAAAIALYPNSGTQCRKVLDFLGRRRDEGATDQEIRAATGVRRARTRRHELMEGGWVEDSGRQRVLGDTGNLAEVWILTEQARAEWRPDERTTYERE